MTYSWKNGLLNGIAIPENSNAPLATLTANDGLTDAFSYSLSGRDRNLFKIDSHGHLSLKEALDYEALDYRANRQFSVAVRAHSDDGARQAERIFILSLENIDDVATGWQRRGNPSGRTLAENNSEGRVVADFGATDGDSGAKVTYSLSGDDANYFSINASNGKVSLVSRLDYEDANHGTKYSVVVEAASSDGSDAISQLYILSVGNVNELNFDDVAASWRIRSSGRHYNENSEGRVANFLARDGDGGGISYWLSGGDEALFSLDERNKLYVKQSFDYESADDIGRDHRYTVVVNALGLDGGTQVGDGADVLTQTYILTIKDRNEFEGNWEAGSNPDGAAVSEDIAIGVELADFGAIHNDGVAVTYGLKTGRYGRDYSYFNIDKETGVLTSRREFDFEKKEHYTVMVRAKAVDGGESLQQVFVLTVGNVDDLGAGWEKYRRPTRRSIVENNEIGMSLADFGATDGDGAAVTYSLSGDDANYFNLDNASGVLTLKSSLNYEGSHGEYYSLVVNADSTDSTNPISSLYVLRVKNAAIEIDWAENGEAASATVNENDATKGLSLTDLSIAGGGRIENDGAYGAVADGEGGNVSYWLSGSDRSAFVIDRESGALSLSQDRNYESDRSSHQYTVVVNAGQRGVSGSISELFILSVSNENEFETDWRNGGAYNRSGRKINENNSEGASIASFRATDGDKVDVTYSLQSGNDSDYFSIDNNGKLYAKSEFDYEDNNHENKYSVVVLADSADESSAISQLYILTIGNANESDINDTTAYWRRRSSGTRRYENEDGRELTRFEAQDSDGPGISYWLSGDDAGLFSIDTIGRLYTKGSFDYESDEGYVKEHRYSVVVNGFGTAGDNGGQIGEGEIAVTQTYILTIKNRNEFESNWLAGGNPDGAAVSEDIAIGVSLADFGAIDGDAVTVTYGLRNRYRDDRYFEIDKETGVLTSKREFDFENKEHYTVMVQARAEYSNDGSARLEQTFVLTVGNIDDETVGWKRSGRPTRRSVIENNEEGLSIANFNATDGDGAAVIYSLSGGDANYFSINSESGVLSLISSLDYEDLSHGQYYSVVVNVDSTDASEPISSLYVLRVKNGLVEIDWAVSDENPSNPSAATVNEIDAVKGLSIADFGIASGGHVEGKDGNQGAIDGDGGNVSYWLLGNNDGSFTIDSDGVLSLSRDRDYETDRSSHQYTVLVNVGLREIYSVSGSLSELFILSVSNENEFETNWRGGGAYNRSGRTINENNDAGVRIASFRATDGDKVAVTYSLQSIDDADYFSLDNSGRLYAKSSFDHEDNNHVGNKYSVVVIADSTDESSAISQTYILTIRNRNEFESNWQVGGNPDGAVALEDITVGTSLADFGAVDGDGVAMTYSLKDGIHGRDYSYFNIDKETGVLTSKQEFDFENKEHYTVMVRARAVDGSASLQQTFVLTVGNADDETVGWQNGGRPSSSSIVENNEIGMSLADFGATDGDGTTVTYSLSGSDANYFNLDNANGVLSLKSSLDYEDSHGQYYSVVVNASSLDASDGISHLYVVRVQNAAVDIKWDINDENPGNPSGAILSENNLPGASVADFNAIDGDNEAVITYSLESGYSDAQYFQIDKDSGILTVNGIFDFESPSVVNHNHRYTVIARADFTDGSASLSQIFILTVGDINEDTNWQVGGNLAGGASIAENNIVGLSLADFRAIDDDKVAVTYSLSGGDANYFNIDTATGMLTAASAFDYENKAHYSVTVVATSTDGSPAISELYILTINDIDNTQGWSKNPSGVAISENNSAGLSLGDFNNGGTMEGFSMTYGLSGDDADYFSIGNQSGWFSAVSSFDYESAPYYSVVVVANANVEGDAISQLFILTINDIDNTEGWSSGPSGAAISENNSIGLSLGDFDNHDAIAGVSITYGLSGDDANYFNIGNQSGWFSVASSFDYESEYGQSIDNRYSVVITANADVEGDAISRTYILTINDIDNTGGWRDIGDDNPEGATIQENNSVGVSVADFDNIIGTGGVLTTYGLSGDDADYFNIDPIVGRITMASSLDYESDYGQAIDNRYSVAVVANANIEGTAISRLFVLTVADVNNTPDWNDGFSLSFGNPSGNAILENAGSNLLLGDFYNYSTPSGIDLTYGLSGSNAGFFNIDATTGSLTTNQSFDYESAYGQSINNRYSVAIVANADVDGDAISRVFVLTVGDVDNTNDWNIDTSAGKILNENRASPITLWDFRNDGPLPAGVNMTYGVTGGDTDYFDISPRDGGDFWRLRAKTSFDYESEYGQSIDNRYSVVITANATEEGNAISRTYILTVGDVSLTPDWSGNPPMGGLVTEDNEVNQALVDFNNDGDLPAGVEVTYGLSGDNASFFQIDNSTGVLKTNHIFDYESGYGQSVNNRYSVAIIANATDEGTAISRDYVLTINDIGGFVLAEPDATPDQPVGINGKILFDPTADNIGGINDGVGNEGLVIIGNDLMATKYEEGLGLVDYSINNPENFADSFVGYTDANGNSQNHWFFVRDDADDLTGHIVFDADGVDVNLDALNNGGATMTADQINLLAGLNFGNDGDFDKPDDLDLDLNDNKAGALTHDQFLSLIGGSNNIDFI